MNIKIVKAVRTSYACPSQWDAWDTDGNYYYLRYRHGEGTVEKFDSPDWRTWPRNLPPIVTFNTEDCDGYITLEDFCYEAGIKLSLKE